ncbi:MAG TPA: hydroxymethylglutaryl-CoA lyase [Cytophagales bacterium]|nr:hydroxymethylglutaryl-CoA lyase [Cytophagales bacterium]
MKIIECPRDAMQGLLDFIPTEDKVKYLNALIQVGFHTIDFGSFVSPKAIPQMSDTAKVLSQLNLKKSKSKLLAIIANLRGATEACSFSEITYLGYPLSVSETFQERNTNKSIAASLIELKEIQKLCISNGKQLVVYLSMAFGNPYGDEYNLTIIDFMVRELIKMNIKIVSIADTIGAATPENVYFLYKILSGKFPLIELGVHLHSTPDFAKEKIDAAYRAGCRRFDTTIRGYGGCPFAKDELVGNIATEVLLSFIEQQHIILELNKDKFKKAFELAGEIFPL